MSRNLKVLGLALVAVCALTAMAASVASAHPTFTTTSGAVLSEHEVGNVKWTITGQETFCEESSYTGTAPAASFTEVGITPTYNKCKAKIFGATINTSVTGFGAGGCKFVYHATGTVDIVCSSGDVTFTAGTCVVHIPAQKGLQTVTYDTGTSAGKKDLTFTLNITKIKETHTDGFLCPFEGGGTTETASLHGTLTGTATVGGVPVDLTDHS